MEIVYATTTAVVSMPGGWNATVRAGSHWPANDPVVQQQPGIFSSDPRHGLSFTAPFEAPVEQATANPGERRLTVRTQADAAADELDQLRERATAAGIKVDGRWSIQRLREELAAVS